MSEPDAGGSADSILRAVEMFPIVVSIVILVGIGATFAVAGGFLLTVDAAPMDVAGAVSDGDGAVSDGDGAVGDGDGAVSDGDGPVDASGETGEYAFIDDHDDRSAAAIEGHSIVQGDRCLPIEPMGDGNESVEDFYDYRHP